MATHETFGKQGKPLHSQAREIVANVVVFMKNEAEYYQRTSAIGIPITNYKQRVMAATGISEKMYKTILKESKERRKNLSLTFNNLQETPCYSVFVAVNEVSPETNTTLEHNLIDENLAHMDGNSCSEDDEKTIKTEVNVDETEAEINKEQNLLKNVNKRKRDDNFKDLEGHDPNNTTKSKISDEYSCFGELVGHKIRNLRTEELRNRAEMEITKLLYDLATSPENVPLHNEEVPWDTSVTVKVEKVDSMDDV